MRPHRAESTIVALLVTLLVAGILSVMAGPARGALPAGPAEPAAPRPSADTGIPLAAWQYRATITRNGYRVFGLNAPLAVLAAQLHQESAWRPDARSHVGALGLAQFMPATGRDMAARYPAECAPYDPLDPRWAIRCQHRYMRTLLDALKPRFDAHFAACDGWAMGLSAYNGGLGWVQRDRTMAQRAGRNPDRWFGHVADTPDPRRARWAVKENRGYPRRILTVLQPRYVKHWHMRGVICRV